MTKPKKSAKGAAKVVAKRSSAQNLELSNKEQTLQRWQLFAQEYVKDFNGARAARDSGYSAKTADVQASRLLRIVKVQELVKEASERVLKRAELEGVDVVRYLDDVLQADARELVEVYVSCCRYCYGIGHAYQYTMGEYNAAREKWMDEGKAIEKFDEKGGVGYDPRKPPAEDCSECFGHGEAQMVLKDTRHLSARAARLYAGAKRNKDGTVSVELKDQLAVAEKLMRHHGQYSADNKQQGAGGLPGVLEVHFVEPPEREHDPLKGQGHAAS